LTPREPAVRPRSTRVGGPEPSTTSTSWRRTTRSDTGTASRAVR